MKGDGGERAEVREMGRQVRDHERAGEVAMGEVAMVLSNDVLREVLAAIERAREALVRGA